MCIIVKLTFKCRLFSDFVGVAEQMIFILTLGIWSFVTDRLLSSKRSFFMKKIYTFYFDKTLYSYLSIVILTLLSNYMGT